MPTKEVVEATTYRIFRTGDQRHRHYQINKEIMGVKVDDYWVQLLGRGQCNCSCPGFRAQTYAPMDHKHVKLAEDFSQRGEPPGAKYKIHGTGLKARIEYLGSKGTLN